MKSLFVYVVIYLKNNHVVLVTPNKHDLDDEYYSSDYSIQRFYHWK